jgi:hypothetical protein
MEVILLTEEQTQEIKGRKFTTDSYFNPIQDEGSNWIISIEEQEHCTNPDFDWIKQCPRIEYKPKPMPNPFEQE